MRLVAICCIFLYNLFHLSEAAFLALSKNVGQLSLFLRNHSVSSNCYSLGIFIDNNRSPQSSDVLAEWLAQPAKAIPLKIISKIESPTVQLRHTVVLVSHMDKETILDTMREMLKDDTVWRRDSRYVLIGTCAFTNASEILHSLWKVTKLLNFVLACTDSSGQLQVLGYNPFKDEIENNTAIGDLFPSKAKNLYGNNFAIAYWLIAPYMYKKNDTLKGTDYDFTMTFVKTINATPRLVNGQNYGYGDGLVQSGKVDMAALGVLFTNESGLRQITYPHSFMDMTAIVKKAKRDVPDVASLFQIFDLYNWLAIIAFLIMFYGLNFAWVRLMGSDRDRRKTNLSLKILILSFSIFNIVFTNVFQSWITTFLIYPRHVKNIDTLDDLIESNLRVYIYQKWAHFTTSKLQDQYVFDAESGMMSAFREGRPTNGSFVITSDMARHFWSQKKFRKHVEIYHRVKESVGTAYMMFKLSPNSLYTEILKEFTMRSFAYGFYSKEWGTPDPAHENVQRKPEKLKVPHLRGVFLLWGVGVVSSILTFMMEICYYHYYNRFRRVFEFVH